MNIQRGSERRHHRRMLCQPIYAVVPVVAALLWYIVAGPAPAAAAWSRQELDQAQTASTLLIGTVPGADEEEISALLAQQGLRIARYWPALNLVQARWIASDASSAQALASTSSAQALLANSPLLRYVTYDAPVEVATLPTDPKVIDQWALSATNVADAWDITRGDERVVIALLDTGFAMNHEDLPLSRLWVNEAEAKGKAGVDDDGNGYVDDVHGWDWIEADAVPDDEFGHGTHVGGIIAAATNNGIGIAGHGQQLRIAPLRVLDEFGSGKTSDLIDALDYAREQGFPIVNLSLTVSCQADGCPALHDAIKAVYTAGGMVISAAGNKGGGVEYPALYPETVAVAATTSGNSRWAFSNYGPSIDLAGPGADVLSTYITGMSCPTPCTAYKYQTGTSMATPHIAALAGLILSVRPDFTVTDTLTLMKATAADFNIDTFPGSDIYLGAGAVDYRSALITASMPLSLTNLISTPLVVQGGSDLDVPAQVELVQPEARWDIAGAVVSYTLAFTDGTPITPPAAAVTNLSGTAQLSFTAPVSEGTYLVTSQAGRSTQSITFTVISLPLTATLSLATLTTTVDSPAIPFTMTLNTPQDVISDVILPLRLTTSLGTFANGGSEKKVYLAEKIYTDKLVPGTIPGTAVITAAVGAAEDLATLAILPGEPAHLSSPLGNEPSLIIASEETVLTFEVTDAYDNPVADHTTVVITSSVGTVEPEEASTLNGVAKTKLTLPVHAPGPVVITATIPATDLVYRQEIPLMQDIFIPLLRNAPVVTQ